MERTRGVFLLLNGFFGLVSGKRLQSAITGGG
jgi:hypothetical protein